MKPEQVELVVAGRIREGRKMKGLSQGELAEKIGAHTPYISDIERGVKSPGLRMLTKIANALGFKLEEFVSDKSKIVA